MKILYSAAGTPIPGSHGGSVHALELCRALARRGHDVHLVALRPGGGVGAAERDADAVVGQAVAAEGEARAAADGAGAVKVAAGAAESGAGAAERGTGVASAGGSIDGVTLHYLRRVLPVTLLEWTAGRALRRLVGRLRPDVVVERFYTFGGAGIGAARRAGVPAVLEVNSPARDYPGSLRDALDRLSLVRPVDRWRRRQLAACAAIYATSRHLLPPELQDDATVIVNGVDVDRFRPGPPAADSGPLRGVYVSSFRSWHGAEDLVAALVHCRDRRIPLRVVCIGEGPCFKAAREAATVAGLDETIEFTGKVPHDRVPRFLAQADVGIAPFTPDRFSALELGWFWSPIKIFEYLAAGLPVITADIPELRALLPGGVANFYTPGDPLALAEALVELEGDRAAVRRMGAAARALAERRYTWDQQAAAVEAVLEGAVQ